MYIRLDSVEKVKEFVKLIENNGAEADLISGRQEVDAKSLLGIFSLDLTKPIQETELLDMLRTYLPKALYHQDQEKQKNSGDSSKNISKTKMEQLQQIAGFEAYIGVKIE